MHTPSLQLLFRKPEGVVTPRKSLLDGRRVRASAPPPEPQTRLYLAGKPICTPGNITTLISRAKTGKTATLGAATAAVITAASGTQVLKPDTLKFTSSNPEGHAVIVIDTEQSPFDAYSCYKRGLDRAGTTDDPSWLYHYSLVGLSASDLRKSLDEAITLAKVDCKAIFMLILDGVADFVDSVNDEAECNTFVNWLRERTVTHDCPAVCVIHSNEGIKNGDDGRGHLGKQLTRKAESNLLLKKDGEVTTITSEKQRKAPITTDDRVAFRWDDTQQRHVSCDPAEESAPSRRGGRAVKHQFSDVFSVFPKKDSNGLPLNELHRLIESTMPITRQSLHSVLKRWAEDGDVEILKPDGQPMRYRATL